MLFICIYLCIGDIISHIIYIFHVQVWPISTWLHSLPQSRSCGFAGTPGRRGKEATVLRTERCNKLDTDLFQWFWMIWGTPMYLTCINMAQTNAPWTSEVFTNTLADQGNQHRIQPAICSLLKLGIIYSALLTHITYSYNIYSYVYIYNIKI